MAFFAANTTLYHDDDDVSYFLALNYLEQWLLIQ